VTSIDGSAFSFSVRPDVPASILCDGAGTAELLRVVLDRLAALLLLLVASPLMLATAWLVRRDGAPATFAHYRVGYGGRLFKCIKFRTMRPDAERILRELLARDPALREEWQRDQKLADDPRVTALGRWLRKSSLDELPQLLNVLRGEMALVGPRPITMAELPRYGAVRWQYLSVLPGITGLWQVSGRNGTSYERRVELDEQYVRTRSIWLDLRILARTVVVVLTRDGAC
jgi:exopolysaccharide production protein ExoY